MPKRNSSNSPRPIAAVSPTIGEIEGRLLVLEMIASSSTAKLLRLHDSQEKAELIAAILTDIDVDCRSRGLHIRDIRDAQEYAEELLKDAQDQADGLDDIKHAYVNRERD